MHPPLVPMELASFCRETGCEPGTADCPGGAKDGSRGQAQRGSRIGYMIYRAPAGAKVSYLLSLSLAPPGLIASCRDRGPRASRLPGATIFGPSGARILCKMSFATETS